MQKDHTRIITACCRSERSLLPDAYAVDLTRVPRDLANAIATVGSDAVSEAFLAVSYSYDALAVTIPGNVIDPSADDVVFAFRATFANTIPDSYCTSDISGSNVEA